MSKRYLGFENICINPSFRVRVAACSSGQSVVPNAARHLPVAFVVFISPVKPCFKPLFLLSLMTYLKQQCPNMFGYFSFKSLVAC